MSSSSNDDYLDKVKAEIRAEAEVARARAPQTPRRAETAAIEGVAAQHGGEPNRRDYAIGELTGAHYSAFVEQAFRAVLKRAPDEAGAAMQVRLLAAGASKAEVLGNLRWSPEGRRLRVRVRGLLPRYLLAKLARVPLLGYAVEWGTAFAGLPLLLRHQRAADTQVAARFDAAAGTQRDQGQRLDNLDSGLTELGAERDRRNADAEAQREYGQRLDALTARVTELVDRYADSEAQSGRRLDELTARVTELVDRNAAAEARTTALEGRQDPRADEMIELRHYVHAANHWIASMQSSLASLDEAAAAERKQADALAAAVGLGAEETVDRALRNMQWAIRLGAELPAAARVLDIGSGDGAWLETLIAHAAAASGVETNHALVARAQARGLPVALGDAQASLGHYADASLDAVTLSAAALAGDDAPVASVLAQIMRALSPGGRVLLRVEHEPYRLDLATGAPAARFDPARWAAVLVAAGFTDSQLLPAAGATAVLVQRPAP